MDERYCRLYGRCSQVGRGLRGIKIHRMSLTFSGNTFRGELTEAVSTAMERALLPKPNSSAPESGSAAAGFPQSAFQPEVPGGEDSGVRWAGRAVLALSRRYIRDTDGYSALLHGSSARSGMKFAAGHAASHPGPLDSSASGTGVTATLRLSVETGHARMHRSAGHVLLAPLTALVLMACGGCGSQGIDRISSASVGPASMHPVPSLAELDPETLGPWASFTQDHFRVGETNRTDSGSDWMVEGTPTGLVDNLPQCTLPCTYTYTGHVWGRVYGGHTGRDYNIDMDDGDRVSGKMSATYGPRDHYGPGADDVLNVFLDHMYKELPNGGRSVLPGMIFRGDVGTNRSDPDYDPALDTATFTLSAEDYGGSEKGAAAGSFYGPNGRPWAPPSGICAGGTGSRAYSADNSIRDPENVRSAHAGPYGRTESGGSGLSLLDRTDGRVPVPVRCPVRHEKAWKESCMPVSPPGSRCCIDNGRRARETSICGLWDRMPERLEKPHAT